MPPKKNFFGVEIGRDFTSLFLLSPVPLFGDVWVFECQTVKYIVSIVLVERVSVIY